MAYLLDFFLFQEWTLEMITNLYTLTIVFSYFQI